MLDVPCLHIAAAPSSSMGCNSAVLHSGDPAGTSVRAPPQGMQETTKCPQTL